MAIDFKPDGLDFKPEGIDFQPETQAGSPPVPKAESFKEFVEPIATFATGAIAEPVAGLAGIVQSVNPFAEFDAGKRAVESTRKALTYMPKTETAQQILGETGETAKPLAEAFSKSEKAIGDFVYEKTGSPALSAAAATLPTAVLEATGLVSGKGVVKAARGMKKAAFERKVAKSIAEAAPDVGTIKDTARGIFQEIDDLGVMVKPETASELLQTVARKLQKGGLDQQNTPKAYRALQRLQEASEGGPVSLGELDQIRKVAKSAASDIGNATEASLGVKMIDEIDDFLDSVEATKLFGSEDAVNVGSKYKIARELWGRARKSEMIQDAFEVAKNQASGFENGIRTQFRSILNNKKRARFLTEQEKQIMQDVVRGTKRTNFFKLLGKLGFSEGQATGLIGGSIGIGVGAHFGGPVGAVTVPLVGQVSKKLAQRMTAGTAEFADQIIRAGRNGKKIVSAYLVNTPKAQRSAAELSELLLNADISNLPKGPIVNEAKRLAVERLAELTGALSATQVKDNNE